MATLTGFETLGTTLLIAKGDEAAVAGAVDAPCGWDVLENLVATAGALGETVKSDAMAYVEKGYYRFKLYASRMLAVLDIVGASVAEPLLTATDVIRDKQDMPSRSAPFLKPQSKWRDHLRNPETNRDRLWVVAVLFHLREAFQVRRCLARSFPPIQRHETGSGSG